MKYAISAFEATTGSLVNRHFARCSFFAIHDTEGEQTEFIENRWKNLVEHAALPLVGFFRDYGVNVVVAGQFGTRAKAELDKADIQMVIIEDPETRVGDIIGIIQRAHERNKSEEQNF